MFWVPRQKGLAALPAERGFQAGSDRGDCRGATFATAKVATLPPKPSGLAQRLQTKFGGSMLVSVPKATIGHIGPISGMSPEYERTRYLEKIGHTIIPFGRCPLYGCGRSYLASR